MSRRWWIVPRSVQIALTAAVAVAALVLAGFALLRNPPTVDAAGVSPAASTLAASPSPSASSASTVSPSLTPSTPGTASATAESAAPTSAPTTAAPTSSAPAVPAAPATPTPPVPVVFLGDGVSAIDSTAGRSDWTAQTSVALAESGAPVQRAVVADDGAGYVHRSSSGQLLSDQASAVVTPGTRIVVLMGSRNDLDQAAAVGESARAALTGIRAQWPAAKVVVIAPVPVAGDSPASSAGLATARDGLRAAASAAGTTFVDALAAGWVLGPGTTTSSTGGLRLTSAGQTYLAQQVAASVRPLVAAAAAAGPTS